MRLAAMGIALLLPGAAGADDQKGKSPDKAGKAADMTTNAADTSPARRIKAIQAEYQSAYNVFYNEHRRAKTDDERRNAAQKYPPSEPYAARLMQVVKEAPKDPAVFDALHWAVTRGDQAVQDDALALLLRDHAANPRIANVFSSSAFYSRRPKAQKLLRTVLEKHSDRSAKAIACYALASNLRNTVEVAAYYEKLTLLQRLALSATSEGKADLDRYAKVDRAATQKEAEGLLERVVKEYADVKFSNWLLGEKAKGDLFEIRELAIGKTAPEITGDDLNGSPMKLSDFRGKVVVLDFWGNW
jgi:hypothetical protein